MAEYFEVKQSCRAYLVNAYLFLALQPGSQLVEQPGTQLASQLGLQLPSNEAPPPPGIHTPPPMPPVEPPVPPPPVSPAPPLMASNYSLENLLASISFIFLMDYKICLRLISNVYDSKLITFCTHEVIRVWSKLNLNMCF